MAEAIARPPSLRAFLDAGGDLTTLPGWDVLAEGVLLHSPASRVERRSRARFFRAQVEEWLTLTGDLTAWAGGAWAPDQAAVTRLAWEAECLADEELAERFEAALPEDKRLDFLLLAVEMLWPEEEK